jgi:hypothetical protein
MNSPTLRECPFCGGEAVVVSGMFLVVNYKVICNHLKNKCAVSPQTKWYTTPAEAIAAWNKRHDGKAKENTP